MKGKMDDILRMTLTDYNRFNVVNVVYILRTLKGVLIKILELFFWKKNKQEKVIK